MQAGPNVVSTGGRRDIDGASAAIDARDGLVDGPAVAYGPLGRLRLCAAHECESGSQSCDNDLHLRISLGVGSMSQSVDWRQRHRVRSRSCQSGVSSPSRLG